MKKNVFIWLIAFVMLVSLACGKSTTERMEQSAASPTQSGASQTGASQTAAPTEAQAVSSSKSTSVPKPTAAPTEAAEALVLQDQVAFVQDGISVAAMFLVNNPNQSTAIEDSKYDVVVFDAAGTVLKSETGYINIVLPGEKLGVVSEVYLGEDQSADHIEVTLTSGQPAATKLSGSPFTSELVEFQADQYFPKVTGTIKNTFNRDITNLKVAAILYDAQENIIGGGYTYLDFLPAQDQTGVEINVSVSEKPARMEIYTSVSNISSFDDTIPVEEGVVLTDFGFTQDGTSTAVVFLVKNNNEKLSIRGTQFQVIAYDDQGKVLATDSGYVEVVYPNQQTAGYANVYLPEGKNVFKVVVQIKSGESEVTELQASPFVFDKVKFYPGTYGDSVSAVITNTTLVSYTSLKSIVIGYGENGELLGGGYTYLSYIPGQGHAAFKTDVQVSKLPTRWEIYPQESAMSSLSAYHGPSQTLQIISQGFSQNDTEASVGFIISNTGQTAVEASEYVVAVYDAAGYVIDTASGYVNLVLPSQVAAGYSTLYLPSSTPIDRVEIVLLAGGDVLTNFGSMPFTAENIQLVTGGYWPKATGVIASSLGNEISSLHVNAIVYNGAGEIIGGGFTYTDLLPANGKVAVEISLTYSGEPARIELYFDPRPDDLK